MTNRPLRPKKNNHMNVEVSDGKREPLFGNDEAEDREEREGAPQPMPVEERIIEHEEARMAVAVRDPNTPTAAEKAENDLTHANFRSWCRACVQGKGVSGSHLRQERLQPDEIRVPTVHAGYAFMGEKKAMTDENEEAEWAADPNNIKMLTVKDGQSRIIRAHRAPKKGVRDQPWVAATVAEDMAILGHTTVIFRTDQERSMKAIHVKVSRLRAPLQTIPEHSLRGAPKSNGVIERGNRTITKQIRVMIIALEINLDCKLKATHRIMHWLVQHAGLIISYYQVGKDGRTPL